jgi:uncharacterized protein YdiU (UPF0061 family)
MKLNQFNFKNSYSELGELFFAAGNPDPVSNPQIVIFNDRLAGSLGINFSDTSDKEKAAILSGNCLAHGSEPISQAYAGHQFGHFTMLGDGRAHLLGEHCTEDGRRFDIQLKGSGPTRFSRNGDGRAVLGPMLREYIISEAMFALGIPTTRSLAVVSTGEKVLRENLLPGAILTRVASSHIRVGTFEFAASQKDTNIIQKLLDYTIDRHEPELNGASNKALAFLEWIIEQQAILITDWMRVGFIHGVMNTDNVALSGETIDYGPCAFMDEYDPNTVLSSIDRNARYSYSNQPKICQWNLARLAEAILPLIDPDLEKSVKLAEEKIVNFSDLYQAKWLDMMRSKLGLSGIQKEDEKLVNDLLEWMAQKRVDYTNTFRDLSSEKALLKNVYQDNAFSSWKHRWEARRLKNNQSPNATTDIMRKRNPAIIPRNHNVERALGSAEDMNFRPFYELLKMIRDPYSEREYPAAYCSLPQPDERVWQTFCGT